MANSQKIVITLIEGADGRVRVQTLVQPALANTQEAYDKMDDKRKVLNNMAGVALNAVATVFKQLSDELQAAQQGAEAASGVDNSQTTMVGE